MAGGGKPLGTALVRLLQLAVRLGAGRPVTSAYIRDRYGVSSATAKRDLVRLECAIPVTVELECSVRLHRAKTLRLVAGGLLLAASVSGCAAIDASYYYWRCGTATLDCRPDYSIQGAQPMSRPACEECGTKLIFLGSDRGGAEYFCPNFARHSPAPHHPRPASRAGVDLIAAERARQVSAEGWTADHDDEHDDGGLAFAAVSYALAAVEEDTQNAEVWWPWEDAYFKPKTPIENLVRAGALIAAEIDRIQRAAASPSGVLKP